MNQPFASEADVMWRAIELARRGEGAVEPNPMVGAVVVDAQLRPLGEGWHERFGGPHAEIGALASVGERSRGATIFVTLEPCCHHGKTPPCTEALIRAGIARVVVGVQDPFPRVAGGGVAALRQAGIQVDVGLLGEQAANLIAPFRMLVASGRPWVHAKWAMTLDGKIASRTGASRWISNSQSRAAVHQLRARMDAIIVGSGTARADDPTLTVRLGSDANRSQRTPTRIVIDTIPRLPLDSQLVRTISEAPVLLAVSAAATGTLGNPAHIAALEQAGVEILELDSMPDVAAKTEDGARRPDPAALLRALGQRSMTNVLVEGGGQLLGSFLDADLIDEVHTFVAPRLMGGVAAPSPVAGLGREAPCHMPHLYGVTVESLDGDVYVRGRVRR